MIEGNERELRGKGPNGRRFQVADGHLVRTLMANDGLVGHLGSNIQSSNLIINLIINHQCENVKNCYYKYKS